MKLGLIGESLSHSFSKDYFSKKFERLRIDASYQNMECASLEEVQIALDDRSIDGFNVTIPYKESIIELLDEVSPEAINIGAVNTIHRVGDKLIGYNTDCFGFHQSIKPYFKSRHERAIILGTGGASKAVEYVLKGLGCDPIFISRNPIKSNEFPYEDINNYMVDACKMIINTTPVGTFPNIEDCPDFPFELLNEENLVIDLIYNPEETSFLKQAKQQGAVTLNGLVMLREQAEKAWAIWSK